MRDPRAYLPRAALGFLSLEPREPELRLLHRWLDSWSGIGHITAGMARQGYDVELRRYDGQGWRAMFFTTGFEHSLCQRSPNFPQAWSSKIPHPRVRWWWPRPASRGRL